MDSQPTGTPPDHRFKEYQDNHYHDEDEVAHADDVSRPPKRITPGKRPPRKLPPKRRYEDD